MPMGFANGVCQWEGVVQCQVRPFSPGTNEVCQWGLPMARRCPVQHPSFQSWRNRVMPMGNVEADHVGITKAAWTGHASL